jgi:hypothetical protein
MEVHQPPIIKSCPRNIRRPEAAAALGKEPWQQRIKEKAPIADLSRG